MSYGYLRPPNNDSHGGEAVTNEILTTSRIRRTEPEDRVIQVSDDRYQVDMQINKTKSLLQKLNDLKEMYERGKKLNSKICEYLSSEHLGTIRQFYRERAEWIFQLLEANTQK
eukprot:UN26551